MTSIARGPRNGRHRRRRPRRSVPPDAASRQGKRARPGGARVRAARPRPAPGRAARAQPRHVLRAGHRAFPAAAAHPHHPRRQEHRGRQRRCHRWVRLDPVTDRFCAQDESARNAGGTPGCGTADGAARRTRGTQTGAPPGPAGPGCRHPACGAPVQREASAALALPVRTRNAGTRVRTPRTGSLAPRPAPCRAAAARPAGGPMRSCIHGRTAVSLAGTTR
jgi:hypothetical protein